MALKVSIITPCFNAAATLERTITSVVAQTYPTVEYIVMDGGSEDGTADIARCYASVLRFVSETDRGQSDAINKGWRTASGDILAWLNADDQYMPDTVERAAKYFDSHPNAAWVYGALISVDSQGKAFPTRNFPMEWDYSRLLRMGCYVPQPTVFLRRSIIDEFGYLEEALHYVMDWEYWLRIGSKYPGHLDRTIQAKMIRSRTTKTESGGTKRMAEIERVAWKYGAKNIPLGNRAEWGMAFLENAMAGIGKKSITEVIKNFCAAVRYPAYFPRAVFKVIVRHAIGVSTESYLRRILLRPGPNVQ